MLVLELWGELRASKSSPKMLTSFLWYEPFPVLTFEPDSWLPTVVELATDGRRSSCDHWDSMVSLVPVREVLGP